MSGPHDVDGVGHNGMAIDGFVNDRSSTWKLVGEQEIGIGIEMGERNISKCK